MFIVSRISVISIVNMIGMGFGRLCVMYVKK